MGHRSCCTYTTYICTAHAKQRSHLFKRPHKWQVGTFYLNIDIILKKKPPVMNWNEQETVDKENTIHEMMYAEYFSVQQILKYSQVYKRVTM